MAELDEETGTAVEPEASPADEQEKKKKELQSFRVAQLPDVNPETLPPKGGVNPVDERFVVPDPPEPAIIEGVPGKGVIPLPRAKPVPLPKARPEDLGEPYDPTADIDIPDPTFVEKVVKTVNQLSPKQVNKAVQKLPRPQATVQPPPVASRPPAPPSAAAPAAVPGPRGSERPVRSGGTSQQGVPVELSKWIMKKEGWAPTAFDDYGQHNIGYGTNARGRTSITREEAYKEMNAELAKHLKDIDQLNPRIPKAIRNSLASLSFNVGGGWMREQDNNLRDAVSKSDWNRAREWFLKYHKAGGKPLGGLVTRRQQEAEAWKDPNYYFSGKGTTSTQDWGGTPDPQHLRDIASERQQTFAGSSQNPGNMAFLAARGGHNAGTGVQGHPTLIANLTQAVRDYEAATGKKARLGEMGRDYATQAKYYANYKAGRGGLAAPPGRSRHQGGNAVDVPSGDFNAWLKANAGKYGLETLTGAAYKADPVHFQLIGTGSTRGSAAAAAAGPQVPGVPDSDEEQIQPQTVTDPETGQTIIINEAPDPYTPPTRYPDPETKLNPFTPTPISFVPPGGVTPSQNAQQTMDQSGFQQKLMDTINSLSGTVQAPLDAYTGKYRGKQFKPGDTYDEEDAFRENVDKDMEALQAMRLASWGMAPFNKGGTMLSRLAPEALPGTIAFENRPGGPLDPSVIHTDQDRLPGEPVLPQEPPPVSGSPPQAQLPTQQDVRASELAALAPSPLKTIWDMKSGWEGGPPVAAPWAGPAPGGIQFTKPDLPGAGMENIQGLDTAIALAPEFRQAINQFFDIAPGQETESFRFSSGKFSLSELTADLVEDWENARVQNPLYRPPSTWAISPGGPTVVGIPEFTRNAVATVVRHYNRIATYLGQVYGLPDMANPANWTPENGRKLDQAFSDLGSGVIHNFVPGAKSVLSGVGQFPGVSAQAFLAVPLAFAAEATESETLAHLAATVSANAQWVNKWVHDKLIRPEDESVITDVGEYAGTILGFSRSLGILKNLKTAGVVEAGTALTNQLHKLPRVPSAQQLAQDLFGITPAQADEIAKTAVPAQGLDPLKDFYLVDTPGGKIAVQKADIWDMAKMGLFMGGVLAGPGLLRGAARGEGLLPRGMQALGRFVAQSEGPRPLKGYPEGGNMVISTPADFARVNALGKDAVIVDLYTRAYNEQMKLGRIGINDTTPAQIMDAVRIYSNSGMRNMVTSAFDIGRMEGPTMAFDVERGGTRVNFKDIVKFADANPEFRDYLVLRQQEDRLIHNNWQVQIGLARGAPPAEMARLRENYPDWHWNPNQTQQVDINIVRQGLRDIEATAAPEFGNMYRGFMNYIAETKRHVADGTHARENLLTLHGDTNHAPSTPVFQAAANRSPTAANPSPHDRYLRKIWDDTINGGADPLFILEREVEKALMARMHNEINGMLINGLPRDVLFSRTGPGTVLTEAELKRRGKQIDPDSLIRHKVNGVIHTIPVDPLLGTMMTHDVATFRGALDSIHRKIKKPFERGTTGWMQPGFSVTAAIRTWWQSLGIVQEGFSRAGPFAIATTAAGKAGERLTRGAEAPVRAVGEWLADTRLGQVLTTPQQMDAVARFLTFHQAREWSAEYQRAGGVSPDIIRNSTELRDFVVKAKQLSPDAGHHAIMDYMGRTLKPPFEMFKSGLREVTDIVPSAWARKNYYAPIGSTNPYRIVQFLGRHTGMTSKSVRRIDPQTGRPVTMNRLAVGHRRLTGDPAERGSRYWEKRGTNEEPKSMPFQASSRWQEQKIKAGKALGSATDAFHAMVPWSGVLIRSPAATLNSMANNPMRSMFWIGYTQMMPELIAYMWNRQLGPEYLDFMLNRSEQSLDNYMYIGVKGRRPEEGVLMPNFQEGRGARALVTGLADVLMGRSPFTLNEEVNDMLMSFLRTNLSPAIPPAASALAAYFGTVIPSGIYGTAWTPPKPGIKELNPPENDLEKIWRAAIPSLADFWIQGTYSAWAHWIAERDAGRTETPVEKIKTAANMFKFGAYSVGHRMLERTPVARDYWNITPEMPASNRVTNEMFKRKKVIDDLIKYGGAASDIANTKAPSKSGGAQSWQRMGPELNISPNEAVYHPGMPQTKPKNPIYLMAINMIEGRFKQDAAVDRAGRPQEGRGFKTMMTRYRQHGALIDKMRNVFDGNAGPWLEQQKAQHQELWDQMRDNGVDTNNHRQVRNYLVTNRNRVAAHMFYYIKQVEWDIDQMPEIRKELGDDTHFTMEMANPLKPGLDKKAAKPK
jgi:GH24 family phage-related lysozyme (muramidase)